MMSSYSLKFDEEEERPRRTLAGGAAVVGHHAMQDDGLLSISHGLRDHDARGKNVDLKHDREYDKKTISRSLVTESIKQMNSSGILIKKANRKPTKMSQLHTALSSQNSSLGSMQSLSSRSKSHRLSDSNSKQKAKRISPSPTRGHTTLSSAVANNVAEMSKLRDQIGEQKTLIFNMKEEARVLNTITKRQEKAIKVMDKEQGELPVVLDRISEEMRTTKLLCKKYLEKIHAQEKSLRDMHEELTQSKVKYDRIEKLLKEKKLDLNEKFSTKLMEVTTKCDEQEKTIQILERKCVLLEKTHQSDFKTAQEKNSTIKRELVTTGNELKKALDKLKHYETLIARESIYSKHLSSYRGQDGGSSTSTTPLSSTTPIPPDDSPIQPSNRFMPFDSKVRDRSPPHRIRKELKHIKNTIVESNKILPIHAQQPDQYQVIDASYLSTQFNVIAKSNIELPDKEKEEIPVREYTKEISLTDNNQHLNTHNAATNENTSPKLSTTANLAMHPNNELSTASPTRNESDSIDVVHSKVSAHNKLAEQNQYELPVKQTYSSMKSSITASVSASSVADAQPTAKNIETQIIAQPSMFKPFLKKPIDTYATESLVIPDKTTNDVSPSTTRVQPAVIQSTFSFAPSLSTGQSKVDTMQTNSFVDDSSSRNTDRSEQNRNFNNAENSGVTKPNPFSFAPSFKKSNLKDNTTISSLSDSLNSHAYDPTSKAVEINPAKPTASTYNRFDLNLSDDEENSKTTESTHSKHKPVLSQNRVGQRDGRGSAISLIEGVEEMGVD